MADSYEGLCWLYGGGGKWYNDSRQNHFVRSKKGRTMNRKEFIKLASGTAALAVAGCVTAEPKPAPKKVDAVMIIIEPLILSCFVIAA